MPTTTTTVTSAAASGATTTVTTTEAAPDKAPAAAPAPAPAPVGYGSAKTAGAALLLESPGEKVDLKGKVALVTGASRGIGQAAAEHLASIGMKVVLTARSVSALEEIVAGIKAKGGEAAHFKLDVTSEAETEAAFAFAEETYGPVYLVYSNAGVAPEAIFEVDLPDLPFKTVRHIIAVNQEAPMLAFMKAYPHFKKNGGGVWIATSSIAAAFPTGIFSLIPSAYALYSSTKAAVVDLAHNFAGAHAKDNIRAYAVCPGVFTTKMVNDLLDTSMAKNLGMKSEDDCAGFNPIHTGKSGDPRMIAPLVEAMADNSSRFPSGAAICIDNDVCFSLEQQHKRVDTIIDCAAGEPWHDIDLDACFDYHGNPLSAEKIASIRK